MNLVTPEIGLIFWAAFIFLILLVFLRLFAWKPILNAVNERNKSISDALNSAKKAKEEMAGLQASNEKILNEAKVQREEVLKEARDMREKMLADAKEQAKDEANKIVQTAKVSIENEKRAAIHEMKNLMATLSVDIAENILTKELSDKESQKELINNLLSKANIN